LAASVPAQGPLELLPADSLAGVAIRDLDDLKQKGDQFIKETELKVSLRPSELFEEAYRFLGVQAPGVVDRRGSAAIVLANPKTVGEELGLRNLDSYIVVALPFSNRDRIGEALSLKPNELKPNQVIEIRA